MDMYRLVKQISTSYLGGSITEIVPILDKGSVNQVFRVRGEGNHVIIRVNNDHRALINYHKEAWCLMQAIQQGIPSPRVLNIGRMDGCAYMIQSFVEGKYGEDLSLDRPFIWRCLGQYVALIGAIKVEGFGENLSDFRTGRFDDTWSRYLQYNIDSLTSADRLIELGVITNAQSEFVRNLFEQLQNYPLNVGLSHGDVSLKNTVISPGETVYLLDWGSAEVFPFGDILQVLKGHITQDKPTWKEYLAFVEGLGIDQAGYRAQEWLVHTLLVLRAFDKLRWAIDRSPRNIANFSAYAAKVFERVQATD